MPDAGPLRIAGTEVMPGERRNVRIPVARRLTSGDVEIPACVINGLRPGPRLFVCAALHGDEINGCEIVRRLIRMPVLRRLSGSLIAVPVVNVYGFVAQSRYLPDRRDLNRSFPGSAKGSLASRLADAFVREVVDQSTHGIDLHTGSLHRTNLPQVRATLDSETVGRMARAFGAPVILDTQLREGSLRKAAHERGIPVIVYEAGEALRFEEVPITAGVRGVVSVMRAIGMLPAVRRAREHREPYVSRGSTWVRAPESGIVVSKLKLGARVGRDQEIASIWDPLGEEDTPILSPMDGVLIGRANLPLANEGDALFHIAGFKRLDSAADGVEAFREEVASHEDLL
jgi:predicted deacylase